MKSRKKGKRSTQKFLSLHSIIIHASLIILLGGVLFNYLVPTQKAQAQKFSTNEILVKFKSSVSDNVRQDIVKKLGGSLKAKIDKINVEVLSVPEGKVEAFANVYKKNPNVEYAEPNAVAQKTMVTNDPSLSSQWGLFSIDAAENGGTSAWDITAGSSNIKIAILDTGIDSNHSDLQGKIVGVANFTSSSGSADVDGHGTHVAGIASASTNNGTGVAGTAYDTSLMNVKVLDDNGSGYYSWIANGVIWAADNGANVINMSLGGSSSSLALQDAVNYAWNKGVVIVAAAGNNGTSQAFYPANYTNVIAVAAINSSNTKTSWSNYGSWVDVAAPGDSIYSTYKGNSYSTLSGTSMASPFVAGVAGLVWSKGDCSTNTCVRSKIESTAQAISGTGFYWQKGKVNAFNAVSDSLSITPTSTSAPTPTSTPTSTPTPTAILSTPTPTPSIIVSNQMTISSLTMWSSGLSTRKTIYAKAVVKDSITDLLQSNATVYLNITSPSGLVTNFVKLTSSNGEVQVNVRSREKGIFKVTVTNVTKFGYTYSPTNTTATIDVQ